MNHPNFQASLFKLEKVEQRALLNTLGKISKLSWEGFCRDKGIKWELVSDANNVYNEKIYSFRFSQKYRGTACRAGEYLAIIDLHVDHDSAYGD